MGAARRFLAAISGKCRLHQPNSRYSVMTEKSTFDILWVLLCAMMVFLMQPGFLCLESGLTRSKNNINVAAKNLCDFGLAVFMFYVFGFGLMFGESLSGLIGSGGVLPDFEPGDKWPITFFLFEAMFCSTAVTIISGAVAERLRFFGYLLLTLLVAGLIYPVFGHWAWSGLDAESRLGWLEMYGFYDFAGSTVVHSVGGWVALAAVLVVGPRKGRFPEGSKPQEIPASNLPISILGTFLIWFGWFGFNGGSTLGMTDQVAAIILNTLLAGVTGLLTASVAGIAIRGYTDLRLMINGSLSGLVAITASANAVGSGSALIIGGIGGLIMLGFMTLLERFRIDDAVGAIPVHLGAGMWGTIAVAIFGRPEVLGNGLSSWGQLAVQSLGLIVCGIWAFGLAYVFLRLISRYTSLRVSDHDETIGLNISEHRARTELFDLVQAMDHHAESVDKRRRVPVEPFTEVGIIAERYNRVMDSLDEAERSLVDSRLILQTVFDSIPHLIFVRDANSRYLMVNKALADRAGKTKEEIVGERVTEISSSLLIDRPDFLERDRRIMESGDAYFAEEIENELPNGGKVIERVLVAPLVNDNAEVVGVFGIVEDVTARKTIEGQLRQAQKMEAIGVLAGGIAHDFNNILQPILTNSEIILSENLEPSEEKQLVDRILRSANRAKDLVSKILLYSRQGDSAITSSDMGAVAKEVAGLMQSTLPKFVTLELASSDDLSPVLCDSSQVHQVLLNICINAAQAIATQGKLRIELSNIELDGVLCVSGQELVGKFVRMAVSDTGTGMDEETIKRIFDPFFTTKGVGEGTGMGLSSALGIIQNIGGGIVVSTQLGKGTTFEIYLPVITGEQIERPGSQAGLG